MIQVTYAQSAEVITLLILTLIAGWVAIRATRKEERATADRRVADAVDAGARSSERRAVQLAENQAAYYAQNDEINKITMFLREAYAAEMAEGRHAGQTLSQTIIQYLQRERGYKSGVLLPTNKFTS